MKKLSRQFVESNLFLEAAIAYARKGWKVFPLAPRSKKPLISREEGGKGFYDATCDETTIREWWEKCPNANIGIRTGKESDLTVPDIDPRNDGDKSFKALWKTINQGKKVPLRTPVAITGGGGFHLYHKHAGEAIKAKLVDEFPGIDIKSDGGYIVAPPSIHPDTGEAYVWNPGYSPEEVDVEPLPEALLNMLKKPSRDRVPSGVEERVNPAKVWGGLPEGKRDAHLFKYLCRIKRGRADLFDLNQIALAIHQCCEKGKHPFSPEEALKCAESAFKYREWPEETEENGLEIWNSADPEPKEIFRGFLREGCALLAGPPKGGKSWIALEMSLSVALGRLCFGHYSPAETGEVLYLDLEDSRGNTKVRLQKLLKDQVDTKLANLKVIRSWPRGEEAVDALEDYLSEHPGIKMVIIDCLIGVRESRSKTQDLYDYDYNALEGYRRLADEYHIAIIIIHHFNKTRNVEDIFDKFSGSTGVQASPHTLIGYDAKRGDRGGRVQVTGKRSGDIQFALERNQNERPVWRDAEEYSMSKGQKEILRELRQLSPDTLSRKDLADILDEKPGTIGKRLSIMVTRGLIERVGQHNTSRYRAIPQVGSDNEAKGIPASTETES